MELPPGSLVDRYTVAGLLGEGGMSVVYKVRHNKLGSLHALKVLTLSTPGLRQRLLLEGQVQASLRHPNIVPVTDVIDVHGALGLVMEFVEGPDLDAMLRAHALSYDQIDALARDIIGAVAAAHGKGLVHRDLKPANILLMVHDDRLVPKITDFGLAKVLAGPGGESANTRTGAMMGTPFYMAPEQVRDAKNVGPAADVFSLGAILYEMITRQRAFMGEDLFEVLTAVASGRFVPVRELVPDVPARMEAAIDRALRIEISERCADCRELLALWNGESDLPRPASPWTGALLVSASGMVRPEPAQMTAASTFADVPRPPPVSQPQLSSSSRSRSRSGTAAPSGALALLGVLVGGGGAALIGLVFVVLLGIIAWLVWLRPDGVAGGEPSVPGVVAPVPVVVEPPPSDTDVPGAQPEEPTPSPDAPAPPRPKPEPDPAPSSGALPPDLDPASTKPNRREEAMLNVYRSQPGATPVLLRVLKTDPSADVRGIAAGVLRARWKDGPDPSGARSAVSWCAEKGDGDRLRAQCLKSLGELGDAKVGALLGKLSSDGSAVVREGAEAGCRKWKQRFPGEPGCGS